MIDFTPPGRPDFAGVLTAVVRVTTVDADEIVAKGRKARTVRPRHLLCLLLRRHTDLTLQEIGERLDGRDHGTVIHGLRAAEALLASDTEFRAWHRLASAVIATGTLPIPPMPVPA